MNRLTVAVVYDADWIFSDHPVGKTLLQPVMSEGNRVVVECRSVIPTQVVAEVARRRQSENEEERRQAERARERIVEIKSDGPFEEIDLENTIALEPNPNPLGASAPAARRIAAQVRKRVSDADVGYVLVCTTDVGLRSDLMDVHAPNVGCPSVRLANGAASASLPASLLALAVGSAKSELDVHRDAPFLLLFSGAVLIVLYMFAPPDSYALTFVLIVLWLALSAVFAWRMTPWKTPEDRTNVQR